MSSTFSVMEVGFIILPELLPVSFFLQVNLYRLLSDLSTLAVSLPFSRSHGRFFISHGFINFEQNISQTYSFLKKQTQAAHSNFNKERISSMINKNTTSIRSSLYKTISKQLLGKHSCQSLISTFLESHFLVIVFFLGISQLFSGVVPSIHL